MGRLAIILKTNGILRVLTLAMVFPMGIACGRAQAQPDDPSVRIEVAGNRLSLTARQADLGHILSRLSEETRTFVSFPADVQRKITTELVEVSVAEAYERLLIGLDYVIIYAGPARRKAEVSEVLVMDGPGNPEPDRGRRGPQARNVAIYEQRVERLRRILAKVGEDSPRGKRYQRQIDNLERRIAGMKNN